MESMATIRRRRELIGFVMFVMSIITGVVYFSWAFFPSAFAHLVNDAAPDPFWALAVPMWICVTVLMAFFVYIALTLINTPGVGDLNTVVDSFTPQLKADPLDAERVVPRFQDIPLFDVCKQLYGAADENGSLR